jgi:hypothetical protein
MEMDFLPAHLSKLCVRSLQRVISFRRTAGFSS